MLGTTDPKFLKMVELERQQHHKIVALERPQFSKNDQFEIFTVFLVSRPILDLMPMLHGKAVNFRKISLLLYSQGKKGTLEVKLESGSGISEPQFSIK